MNTRFIGVKELRQNMARITTEAQKKNERVIVLKKNKPLFELRPLSEKERVLEKLLLDVEKAQEDVRAGRVYSLDEVRDHLGIE